MNKVKELLGEELYRQVHSKLGEKDLIIDNGMLIPKHRFDCVNISLREHKAEVERLREENAQISRLLEQKSKAEEQLSAANTELEIIKIVLKFNPKNFFAVRALINADGLTGAKLKNYVNRRLKELIKAEPYLFKDKETLYRLVPVALAEEQKDE